MQITIKLMGILKSKSPENGVLELSDGATIDDLLASLEIPGTHVQVVSVNGRPEKDRTRALAAGDDVTILPPVAGG